MRICGGTNYEGHTLPEIKEDFKEIYSRAKKIILLGKGIRWAELPFDLAAVYANVIGLAQRIDEEKKGNILFLFGKKPSASFSSTMRTLGQKATELHLEIGRVWNSGGYYDQDNFDVYEVLYVELRNFCCWAMDLDNIGFELDKRFSHMEKLKNTGIVAGGNVTVGGDMLVNSKKGAESAKRWYENPLGIVLLGVLVTVIAGGLIFWLGWN